MENKQISKNILKSIQATVRATKEQVIDEKLITEVSVIAQPIAEFYQLNSLQAIVFAFVLEYAYRDFEVNLDRLIDHFGAEMGIMADINEAMEQLAERKLVYYAGRTSSRRSKLMKAIKPNDQAIAAMLKGDTSLLENKVDSFFDMLEQVNDMIRLRMDGLISSITLVSDVYNLLEINSRFPEVKWLLEQKTLDNYDLTILLNVCIDQANGEEDIDFDRILKEVFDDFSDRIKYKRFIKEENCPLFKNKFLEFTFSDFMSMDNVKLSVETMDVLLGGYKTSVRSNYKPQMGSLINPDRIGAEQLFYNHAERDQIETLKAAFSDDNYKSLLKDLLDNQMRPGFTVLLHGYPGTGKTSSVKQIAKATGRNILMVDIEKIQSKWVGDSEKNLSKVFKEYKQCRNSFDRDPILLFNESDALLNKRINAKTSTDKMGNAMQNILLQELEDFEGIFFATTNLANQLDTAFDRRFLYKVEFNEPGNDVRFNILKSVFPDFDEIEWHFSYRT